MKRSFPTLLLAWTVFSVVAISPARAVPLPGALRATGGTWVLTGSLRSARVSPMAATLPSGKVLVAGGFDTNAIHASAEVFKPLVGTWSSTGNMHMARYAASLTVLANGKVLVVGGFIGSSPGVTATAEIYDPATGRWSQTGSMFQPRASHTATLLVNGMVLVAGGVGTDQSFAIPNAELFNPATGTWSKTGSMSFARDRHAAARLSSGMVLVSGGDLDYLDGAEGSTELFKPVTGHWSTVGRMTTSRRSHTETVLPDGTVLVVGGSYGNFAGFNFLAMSDRYNPQTGRWSKTGDMRIAVGADPTISGRQNHTATSLLDGRVLVAGGDGYLTDFSTDVIFASAELYDPTTGVWTLTGSMNIARSEHAAVALLDGRVLAIGGSGVGTALASAELYSPTSASTDRSALSQAYFPPFASPSRPLMSPLFGFSPITAALARVTRSARPAAIPPATVRFARPFIGRWTRTGSMHVARIGAPLTLLPNGKVLVEGCDGPTLAGKTAELYDPATGTWATTGSMHIARCNHGAILLPTGRVMVAGGLGMTNHVASSAELYDPSTGAWTFVSHMNSTRYFATINLLTNGKALVAAGNAINGIPRDSADLFDPATNRWTATPSLNLSRNGASSALMANGKVLVQGGFTQNSSLTLTTELYDPVANAWTFTGSTEQQALRVAALSTGQVLSMDEPGNGPTGTTSELYNPSTGSWTPTVGKMNFPRANDTATRLSDGRVMVAGGCNGFNCVFIAKAEIYNPATQMWSLDAPLNTPRESHSAVLLPGGRVLIAGGYDANLQRLTSAELFTP